MAWYKWFKGQVNDICHDVAIPDLRDTTKPELDVWLADAMPYAQGWGPSSVVIGHSLGGVVALRALAREDVSPIRGLVLIAAPACATVHVDHYLHFFNMPIDWEVLKKKIGKLIIIQCKDDKMIPYDHSLRYHEVLGGKLSLISKGGHFMGRTCSPAVEALRELAGEI